METFGARLHRAVAARGPLCVGIDPHPELLARWGLADSPAGLATFAATVVEALAGRLAVLKPQSAFFERFGSAGIAVLESTIRQSRAAGAIVLLDVKRGDIASTAQAYGQAYLNPASPLCCDAITVSPYPGMGALEPIKAEAAAHGGGVFVLALTSNPDGRQVQEAVTEGGLSVAQLVIDQVSRYNDGSTPLGSVGIVVGATTGAAGHDLSRLNGPVLAPGLGAQGAQPADLHTFAGLSGVVLPSYSREILGHGPGLGDLRGAADRAAEDCQKVLQYPIT